MHSHWSLVGFTLLIQSTAGSVWCLQAALILSAGISDVARLRCHFIVALAVALVGLVAALGHLGHFAAGIHGIRNIKSSWLSRELSTVSVFVGFLAVMAAITIIIPGSVAVVYLLPLASLAAVAALISMILVYRLKTVPSWNHAGTPLNHLGSTLLLGGLLFLLVSIIGLAIHGAGIDNPVTSDLKIGYTAIAIGFGLKMFASLVTPVVRLNLPAQGLFWMAIARMVGAVALLAMIGLSAKNRDLRLILLLPATVGLWVGEIIHRIRFYQGYHRVGL
jgi:DMSO reductase anchor subunit